MSTSLFLDQHNPVRLEKIAAPIQLSDNADNWQREIASEVYKQLPFLEEYAVNVMLSRVRPENGYALGSAEVRPKAEIPSQDQPSAQIPLIVKDRLLQPVDVYMFENKAYPLNEGRLQRHLFQGSPIEVTKREPPASPIGQEFQPPVPSSYGGIGGISHAEALDAAGFGKMAHVRLIDAIADTIPPDVADNFINQISEDPQMKIALARNDAFAKAARKVAESNGVSAEKTAQEAVDRVPPTVVQFYKQADGNVRIRWANAHAFLPKDKVASPGEAVQMSGDESISQLQPGDAQTFTTEQAQGEAQPAQHAPIQEFGFYSCQIEETGTELEGVVFPVVDWTGEQLDLFLFTNGEVHALQPEMAGKPVEPGEIPESTPDGQGAFILENEEGVIALMPVTVRNEGQDEDGSPSWTAFTADGQEIVVMPVEGLQGVQEIGEGIYGIPMDASFVPVGEGVTVGGAQEVNQLKMARAAGGMAELFSNGPLSYTLRGEPFSKLAADQRQDLSPEDVMFLLGAAGVPDETAREKLAWVTSNEGFPTTFVGLTTITPMRDEYEEMRKQAHQFLSENFPQDAVVDTVKIASSLEDSETADNILALNFINPENIAIFASYMPTLEETAQKLAEMLIAARLGTPMLDETALEHAMRNLEKVISSLRALDQKQVL